MRITRRKMMAGGTAIVAATACGESLLSVVVADDKSAAKKFKKAVKVGMVKHGTTMLEKFQLLKELGFDGIELDSPSGVTVEEAKRCIGETGVNVPGVVDSVHWKQRLSDPNEEVRAKGLEALKGALKFSKEIGGTSVLLVPGQVTPDATYEQAWQHFTVHLVSSQP